MTPMSTDGIAAAMEWGECWLQPSEPTPELIAEVKRATGGIVPTWAHRLASAPWVVRAFARTNEAELAYMPPVLWGLIAFVVSQDNSCRYCYGATRAILKIVGYSDDVIDRLERDVSLAEISPANLAALRFARRLSQANPRPTPHDVAALVGAGFSRAAVAEITYTAGVLCFHNRLSTLFALPTEAFTRWVDNPLMRLVRPFLARKFRVKPRAAVAPPAPNDPPFDALISALEGSPSAHTLRRTIDEALASSILPRRTKLLMFAVIARTLGCPRTEADARRGLGDEGLTTSDVDQILANLGAPTLDPREQLLVPFARETVRYRNVAIQERTRALAERLRIEEVVEAVGIASLANTVGRVSVILETC